MNLFEIIGVIVSVVLLGGAVLYNLGILEIKINKDD